MRISAIMLSLALLAGAACTKEEPAPTSVPPVEPEKVVEKPDSTKYPLVGNYTWRVVTQKMIRHGSTTINNWDLTMKFSANSVRYTYNGGAISDYPTSYHGDTVMITFPGQAPTMFWKSMHKVSDKYEWHLEGANCHCQDNAEDYDVYFLRR